MLNNYFYTLCNISIMQFYKACNLPLCRIRFTTRIVFDFLVKLVKSWILCIVLQNIKNKALFYSLLHRINVKCFSLAMRIQTTKQLNCCRLRCSCKCKNWYICLLTVSFDFTWNHIFNIWFSLITRTKRHCYRSHIFTCSRRMCLINNYCKTFILKVLYTINNIRELLNCGCNNLCITIQCNRKVSWIALIVHNTNQSGLMLHSHDCFLKLTVNNNSVSDNNDVVKNYLVFFVMKRC